MTRSTDGSAPCPRGLFQVGHPGLAPLGTGAPVIPASTLSCTWPNRSLARPTRRSASRHLSSQRRSKWILRPPKVGRAPLRRCWSAASAVCLAHLTRSIGPETLVSDQPDWVNFSASILSTDMTFGISEQKPAIRGVEGAWISCVPPLIAASCSRADRSTRTGMRPRTDSSQELYGSCLQLGHCLSADMGKPGRRSLHRVDGFQSCSRHVRVIVRVAVTGNGRNRVGPGRCLAATVD